MEDESTAKQFSSEIVLELLFDDRAVASAGEASSTEAAVMNVKMMKISCLLLLQRMRMKIRTW